MSIVSHAESFILSLTLSLFSLLYIRYKLSAFEGLFVCFGVTICRLAGDKVSVAEDRLSVDELSLVDRLSAVGCGQFVVA